MRLSGCSGKHPWQHGTGKQSDTSLLARFFFPPVADMKSLVFARQVESSFNRKAGYPWVFLNDEPFTEECVVIRHKLPRLWMLTRYHDNRFKRGVRQMTRSEIHFGVIPQEHWSYPPWVDQDKAAVERQKMQNDHVIYAGSESYRHMCRFNSGFFFKHPIMEQFDYYWRVEPYVSLGYFRCI